MKHDWDETHQAAKFCCTENDSLESIVFRLSNHFLFPFARSIILSRLKQILSEPSGNRGNGKCYRATQPRKQPLCQGRGQQRYTKVRLRLSFYAILENDISKINFPLS